MLENCASSRISETQEVRSVLREGDLVRVRGDDWRIVGLAAHQGCDEIRLCGIGGPSRGHIRTLLVPFDRPVRHTRTATPRVVRPRGWIGALRALETAPSRFNALRTPAFADMELLAYQLEPALAVAGGLASRLLLADEVGLGKTVQAGLILCELEARGRAGRVLVLTPAGIREQWVQELRTRFSIEAVVADADFMRRTVQTLPAGISPWTLPGVFIASLDFVKRPEVLQALDSIVWDALVIDEAHTAAGASDRAHAARALGSRARLIVLLTATPHTGADDTFATMCDIGCIPTPRDSDPLLVFRRTRTDVGLHVPRRGCLLAVSPTPDERRMHALLERYTRKVLQSSTGAGRTEALLAMTVLKKRSLSSARSLATSVSRRLELLAGRDNCRATQVELPLLDDGGGDEPVDEADAEPVAVLAAPGLQNAAHERAWLGAIREAAVVAARAESKMAVLERLLRRSREPVIVFTEYRDTLVRLAAALPADGTVCLHGGHTRAERRQAESRFNCGDARLLLATDAAGSGLNLQRRCRRVVNYELPWNPMRLVQRIGRVDRIGQTRTVHAVHLVARDTAEADVLARLVTRLERVRASMGCMDDVTGRLREDLVAAAVIAGDKALLDSAVSAPPERANRLSTATTLHVSLRDQASAELVRLVRARSAARSEAVLSALARRGPWLACVPARRGRTTRALQDLFQARPVAGLLFVLRGSINDIAGNPIETVVVPVHVPAPDLPRCVRSCDVRALVAPFIETMTPALCERAREHLHARLHTLSLEVGEPLRRARDREVAIAGHLAKRLARALVQPGLFDRRAIREHDVTDREIRVRQCASNERIASLDAALSQSVGEIEVAMVLALTN